MSTPIQKFWAKWRPLLNFKGSRDYWQQRYRRGGDSGVGSGGEMARFKADVLNAFVARYEVESVVEFGCGDGRQLTLINYPKYLGLDISLKALEMCSSTFAKDPSKRFGLIDDHPGAKADMSVSLDVLFHLVEDEIYHQYLKQLFEAGSRFVVLFSSDQLEQTRSLAHVRHRPVSQDIAQHFPEFHRLDPELEVASTQPEPHDVPMKFLFYRKECFGA